MNNKKNRPTLSTYNLPFDSNDHVQFSFSNVIVETVSLDTKEAKKELRISIQEEVEIFDSASESARYSRPILLVALGVLSFVSGRDFSVYEVTSSSSSVLACKKSLELAEVKCSFDGVEYSKELEIICSSINDETYSQNTLLFSLLDRWRKAQHQLIESDGQGLFEDDSLLSFFHILELLVSEYQDKQKAEAQEKITFFLNDLMSTTFKYRGPSLDGKVNEKNKVLKDVLLSGDLMSVGSRINYMFEQLGLLDERVQYLLQELIEARNSIAHGRQVFRDRLIWPLPPFFMLHANHFNLGYFIYVLTARSISCHYKLDLWRDEWAEILNTLSPPLDVVRAFLKNKSYQGLSTEGFCQGDIDRVTPASIIDAYIKRKVKLLDIENSFSKLLQDINPLDESIAGIGEPLYIFIFMADSENIELAKFCRESIQSIYDNRTFSMSNIKDYLRFLEHYNIKLNWFREWIVEGMVNESEKGNA